MVYKATAVAVFILIAGCNHSVGNKPTYEDSVRIGAIDVEDRQNQMKYSKAAQLVDSSTMYVEMSIRKKISNRKSNQLSAPLMKRMDSINKLLPLSYRKQLEDYRIKRANDLVDIMVERNRKAIQ